MRSGNCSLEFQIAKDGKGLKGAHFLVTTPEKPEWSERLGYATHSLVSHPEPIAIFEVFDVTFGYKGLDNSLTRYAVSDGSGVVRFDKLPKIPVKIEVLVPTANFTEAGNKWQLWMEVEPGNFKIAELFGLSGSVDRNTPPAVVELKEGETVYYPKLIVRPAAGLDANEKTDVGVEGEKVKS